MILLYLGPWYVLDRDCDRDFTDKYKLVQYSITAITIYGAVRGGIGDSERDLAVHPSETAMWSKVARTSFSTLVADGVQAPVCRTAPLCYYCHLD